MKRVLDLVNARRGHFRLESGYHASLFLDLETLCLTPARVRPLASALATKLAPHRVDAVCGPLVEGAFVAMQVAEASACAFTYATRQPAGKSSGLFSVRYSVPEALHPHVRGKRVAVVNDVISAGSAVLGTIADLQEIGADVVVVSTLLLLGDAFREFAGNLSLPIEYLEHEAYEFWTPEACPLCAAGEELDEVADA